MLRGALRAIVLLLLPGAALASVLPYPVHKKTLPNGLDLVVIEMPEFKGVLSYNTMVLAGSRNETEAGKTGLAHLFEHILFRHRHGGEEGGYDKAIARLGAHNNAWTWFDVTYYHPLTFARNFSGSPGSPGILELESERFKALNFTRKIFQTEAGAVLGEYRRSASAPSLRLSERLLGAMFPTHPYGHATLGAYEDIADMPNEHQAALQFYDWYYRPNNCVVVLAGDVKAAEVLPRLAEAYGSWRRRPVPPVPAEKAAPKAGRMAVGWDADVAPLVWVSYRMPAFSPGTRESAVAQVLEELLVSPAAPLYKELRYEKRSVSALGFEEGREGFESFDPRLLTVGAQLFKERHAQAGRAYFDEVAADIAAGVEALQGFSRRPGAEGLLEVVKSKYRYDFLAGLSSPAAVAAAFSWYYRFGRDPKVLDRLVESVQALRPADIDAFAREHLRPENRITLHLASQEAKP